MVFLLLFPSSSFPLPRLPLGFAFLHSPSPMHSLLCIKTTQITEAKIFMYLLANIYNWEAGRELYVLFYHRENSGISLDYVLPSFQDKTSTIFNLKGTLACSRQPRSRKLRDDNQIKEFDRRSTWWSLKRVPLLKTSLFAAEITIERMYGCWNEIKHEMRSIRFWTIEKWKRVENINSAE